MTLIKTQNDIRTLQEAGRRLSFVMDEVTRKIISGATPQEIDKLAEKLIREKGDTPAFLGYHPQGARTAYPATLCVSVNNEVVHSIPGSVPFKSGDLIGIDAGLFHKCFAVDMARTVPVGDIDRSAQKLLFVTEGALHKGIAQACVGKRIGDIGNAIGNHVKKHGFSIVRELGGHGIGKEIHEEPFIANYGEKGEGVALKEGKTIAIEPIVNEGEAGVILDSDGYTYKTKDGKRSAHFEHTVLVTKKGPEIITKK